MSGSLVQVSLQVQDGRGKEAAPSGPNRKSATSGNKNGSDSPPEENQDDNEEDTDTLGDTVQDMEEVDKLRMALSTEILEKEKAEKAAHGNDGQITGNTGGMGNVYASKLMDEIRSGSIPRFGGAANSTKGVSSIVDTNSSSCRGKYVYVYDLPPEFNKGLVKRCDSLVPWFGLCPYFSNSGTGKAVGTNETGKLLVPDGRWFKTHQYALELVMHARVLKYKCRTEDRNLASLFYVPYYGGLDVIRWHWALNATNDKRDALGRQLVRWLEKQSSWNRRGGSDHVLVLGKISWDFRRQVTGDWGSRLLEFPEMQKITKLLIERNPWHSNDIGVPHPTFFHPGSAADIRTWIQRVEQSERTSLVSFVGKDRHQDPKNVRTTLIKQCRNATKLCRFFECERDLCLQPAFVTKSFLSSHFCMQPTGDSPTRRSVFDSLVAGCIPVLFHPCTAYLQYPWHLPANGSSYSVYISELDVKAGKVNVIDVLTKISKHDRAAMRKLIIEQIIPGLVYALPGSDVSPYKDAFDIVIENLLYRNSHMADLDQMA